MGARMGKASSAKKVARAARAGSSTKRERPKIGFPLAVFAIVVLGTSLVVFARTSREPASAAAPSYLNSDHWHAAYGVYVCDTFLPSWVDAIEDRDGIHTHGDGIIHIHPFSSAASGDRPASRSSPSRSGSRSPTTASPPRTAPSTRTATTATASPRRCRSSSGSRTIPTRPGEVYTDNFNNIVFDTDRAAYTIAVVPEGVVPPLPETVPGLDNLTDVPGSGAPAGSTRAPSTRASSTRASSRIDPATGQPVIPTDSTVTPPVTDAAVTPTSAAESDPASSTP